MPPEPTLNPGAVGGIMATELAKAQRQLTLARQEHGEALDLLNRVRQCYENWFYPHPERDPLYVDICKYLDIPMVVVADNATIANSATTLEGSNGTSN